LSPKAEGRPPERPSQLSPSLSLRLAVVAALEAFETGDQALAVAILLGALEDGPSERRYRCGCAASFEWPGELDHHQRFAHEAAA